MKWALRGLVRNECRLGSYLKAKTAQGPGRLYKRIYMDWQIGRQMEEGTIFARTAPVLSLRDKARNVAWAWHKEIEATITFLSLSIP